MSEEIKEIHIKTYDEWLKYYENATKEQVIEDLTRDVQYFADAVKDIKDLQQKVEQLENIRKEATEYINHATIGADSSPIEDRWLYNLYETRYILNKGDNNGRK